MSDTRPTRPPTSGAFVTTREIYDEVQALKTKVTTMTAVLTIATPVVSVIATVVITDFMRS